MLDYTQKPSDPSLTVGFRSYYKSITVVADGMIVAPELHKSTSYARRLSTNRHFAASLLKQLVASFGHGFSAANQCDASISWLTALPNVTSAALLEFKSLNRLSSLPLDELRDLFAEALALCFGGYKQLGSLRMAELHREYGIVVDNARDSFI